MINLICLFNPCLDVALTRQRTCDETKKKMDRKKELKQILRFSLTRETKCVKEQRPKKKSEISYLEYTTCHRYCTKDTEIFCFFSVCREVECCVLDA